MVYWSGKSGSNRRHFAWQANILPTELFPHISTYAARMYDLYLSAAYDAANAFGFTNGTTLHIPLM